MFKITSFVLCWTGRYLIIGVLCIFLAVWNRSYRYVLMSPIYIDSMKKEREGENKFSG